MSKLNKYWLLFFVFFTGFLKAQSIPPGKYFIEDIVIEGVEFADKNSIVLLSGLTVGQSLDIPGTEIPAAVAKLWEQSIFSDVAIEANEVRGDKLFLKYRLVERPRISKYTFSGITKSQADDLREKIKLVRGTILTEPKKRAATRIIKNFFQDKGHFSTEVEIETQTDPSIKNGVEVNIKVKKGPKVKIDRIEIEGNDLFASKKIKNKFKKTKEAKFYRVWARSKYIRGAWGEDQKKILAFYNSKGFRDAQLVSDTFYLESPKKGVLKVKVFEGNKYYIRNIEWVGNTKYSTEYLQQALNIKKGDVYNAEQIDKRISIDPNGTDISSLYLDDGYLFFRADPVEVRIEKDSIDLEIRVSEGPQARINKIIIEGNNKTSDYVILRELRTIPGEKFSRQDLIRSQRELINLGYFNQENMNVIPIPNQQTGTVDIKYIVEEKSSDQLQLQGGWGGRIRDANGNVIGGGFVGTLGLTFNNFSTKRFFDKHAWRPLPAGDGQKVSLNIQANGNGYQNYSMSFMEPWFGGKKPNSLGISSNYSIQQNRYTGFRLGMFGSSIDFGQRMRFPDDFFRSHTSLSYRYYDVRQGLGYFQNFNNGYLNVISLSQVFERSSIDAPIFPRTGSSLTFSMEFTPPYSLFTNKDYSTVSYEQKHKWMEFNKFKFEGSWFMLLSKKTNTVFNARFRYGFLGGYTGKMGLPPLERFNLGGDGMQYSFFGAEIIGLRGYGNQATDFTQNAALFNKITLEVRQPISLNQSATIWVQGFLDLANSWEKFENYSPFTLKRSAGVGVRVFLPFFGLLGVDFAHPFDRSSRAPAGKFPFVTSFVLGQNL